MTQKIEKAGFILNPQLEVERNGKKFIFCKIEGAHTRPEKFRDQYDLDNHTKLKRILGGNNQGFGSAFGFLWGNENTPTEDLGFSPFMYDQHRRSHYKKSITQFFEVIENSDSVSYIK